MGVPQIPDVAFVEFPPQNGLHSNKRTLPPCSSTVWAAESPANPPPITITYVAIIFF